MSCNYCGGKGYIDLFAGGREDCPKCGKVDTAINTGNYELIEHIKASGFRECYTRQFTKLPPDQQFAAFQKYVRELLKVEIPDDAKPFEVELLLNGCFMADAQRIPNRFDRQFKTQFPTKPSTIERKGHMRLRDFLKKLGEATWAVESLNRLRTKGICQCPLEMVGECNRGCTYDGLLDISKRLGIPYPDAVIRAADAKWLSEQHHSFNIAELRERMLVACGVTDQKH